jgi:hypothetical protein
MSPGSCALRPRGPPSPASSYLASGLLVAVLTRCAQQDLESAAGTIAMGAAALAPVHDEPGLPRRPTSAPSAMLKLLGQYWNLLLDARLEVTSFCREIDVQAGP